ncbi:MAG: hypothetical protein GY807_05385 [Gammaproteobacteria bacterium]|nr:hypothetical protein [Gammaproteobacteria bacterium]
MSDQTRPSPRPEIVSDDYESPPVTVTTLDKNWQEKTYQLEGIKPVVVGRAEDLACIKIERIKNKSQK